MMKKKTNQISIEMKTIKTILLAVAGVAMMTACLNNDDAYQAGFPTLQTKYGYRFANTTTDSLFVSSFGNWTLNRTQAGGEWCQIATMKGSGYVSYGIPITLEQNRTGSQRSAMFRIEDTSHPDDAHADFSIVQLATRGDGSLGNAPLVKSVTGSDGSSISVTYDELCRPLTFRMAKGETVLSDLSFRYDDARMVMRVNDKGQDELSATYTNDYQPYVQLASQTDTVEMAEQSLFNVLAGRYAFNIEHRRSSGRYDAYAYLMSGINILAPDHLHNADSLRYISGQRSVVDEKLFMAPTYSDKDNRCQSLDVNQLLLGVEHCNPYMLLSLFRAARNTSIFDVVKVDGAPDIQFSTTLNADKSVSQLAVTRSGETITYQFEY